jgi:hypothetical protein
LAKTVDEVKIYVETYREIWKKTGCTLMADGWTDQKRRTLINFLVYCPKGTVFLKTVDVSDVSETAKLLYQLFREVVLYVGVENIVHMVTDNAANYVAAGKLMEEFPSIFWSPYAAHCINLSYSRTLVNCSQFVVLLSMLLVSQSIFIIIVIYCI